MASFARDPSTVIKFVSRASSPLYCPLFAKTSSVQLKNPKRFKTKDKTFERQYLEVHCWAYRLCTFCAVYHCRL
jgi:hypothetical protein